jgi:hypothetical protein
MGLGGDGFHPMKTSKMSILTILPTALRSNHASDRGSPRGVRGTMTRSIHSAIVASCQSFVVQSVGPDMCCQYEPFSTQMLARRSEFCSYDSVPGLKRCAVLDFLTVCIVTLAQSSCVVVVDKNICQEWTKMMFKIIES